MKFWEAVEIARTTGKEIRCLATRQVAEWSYEQNRLGWNYGSGGGLVFVKSDIIDSEWEVIEPPLPEYSFAEAFAMMKQEKWMKALSTGAE